MSKFDETERAILRQMGELTKARKELSLASARIVELEGLLGFGSGNVNADRFGGLGD